MQRPFKDVRPIGPFAERDNSGLEIVVFTDVDVPESFDDDIKRVAENEMGRQMQSVRVMGDNTGFVVDVGPEILLEHDQFKTYEDMLDAVLEQLSEMMDKQVAVDEVTARCDSVSLQ